MALVDGAGWATSRQPMRPSRFASLRNGTATLSSFELSIARHKGDPHERVLIGARVGAKPAKASAAESLMRRREVPYGWSCDYG